MGTRTKKNIEGYTMDDSLSFEHNENVDYARKTLYKADKEFFPDYGIISESTSASSKDDPQIVHIFLKQSDFERITEKKRRNSLNLFAKSSKKPTLSYWKRTISMAILIFTSGFILTIICSKKHSSNNFCHTLLDARGRNSPRIFYLAFILLSITKKEFRNELYPI